LTYNAHGSNCNVYPVSYAANINPEIFLLPSVLALAFSSQRNQPRVFCLGTRKLKIWEKTFTWSAAEFKCVCPMRVVFELWYAHFIGDFYAFHHW